MLPKAPREHLTERTEHSSGQERLFNREGSCRRWSGSRWFPFVSHLVKRMALQMIFVGFPLVSLCHNLCFNDGMAALAIILLFRGRSFEHLLWVAHPPLLKHRQPQLRECLPGAGEDKGRSCAGGCSLDVWHSSRTSWVTAGESTPWQNRDDHGQTDLSTASISEGPLQGDASTRQDGLTWAHLLTCCRRLFVPVFCPFVPFWQGKPWPPSLGQVLLRHLPSALQRWNNAASSRVIYLAFHPSA